MFNFDNLSHFNKTAMRTLKNYGCRFALKQWVLANTITPTDPIEISFINSNSLLGSDHFLKTDGYAIRKNYMPGENNTVRLQVISLELLAYNRYKKDEFKLCFDGLEACIYFGRGNYNQLTIVHPNTFNADQPFLTVTSYPNIELNPSTSKIGIDLPTCPYTITSNYVSLEMDNTIHCQDERTQALALLLERALELASDENELLALMLGYTQLTTSELITLLGENQNANHYNY